MVDVEYFGGGYSGPISNIIWTAKIPPKKRKTSVSSLRRIASKLNVKFVVKKTKVKPSKKS